MSTPVPDPTAPVCSVCQLNGTRRIVQETQRSLNAVNVSVGVLWDADGRKHEHYGTPSGVSSFRCECGHRWTVPFKATLYPCWCGWGVPS